MENVEDEVEFRYAADIADPDPDYWVEFSDTEQGQGDDGSCSELSEGAA